MNNSEILQIALKQSSIDMNCRPEDFLQSENKVVLSKKNDNARVYLPLPLECDMVSYGSNIVAQTSRRLFSAVSEYISKYPFVHCFETPNIHALDDVLLPYGLKTCFMAEYFLPDVNLLTNLSCEYELKLLYQGDFSELYTPSWSNALCEKRKDKDVIAVGAYDSGRLIGLAGASADCETMYQIGIDVLPAYRRKGVASAITSRLAAEILKLGKVPFYCAAWSNIPSVRNALKCGFRPAWAELTARNIDFVNSLN